MATGRRPARQNPNRVAVKVVLQNFSDTPAVLIGKKTGVSYGKRQNGDTVSMWKSDALASPHHFVIQEEKIA